MHRFQPTVLLVFLALAASSASAQEQAAARDSTREKLRQLLDIAGRRTDVNTTFRPSQKQFYNFSGRMTDDLVNCDALEIVLAVTQDQTIGLRVYPLYKGGYVNLDKVNDGLGFMRQLMRFNDLNFLFWGADSEGDIFSGYTFTLESGFPTEAILVVIRSIRGTDKFVGKLRRFIDGSVPPSPP